MDTGTQYPPSRGKRAIYMVAGSLATVAVIVLAATELPNWVKTEASSMEDLASDSVPPQGLEETATPPATQEYQPAEEPPGTAALSPPDPPEQRPYPEAVKEPPPSPPPPPVDEKRIASLRELRKHMMLMAGRIAAVRGSLNTLHGEQARSGLGLRGDMAAAEKRMEFYMDEAEAALSEEDPDSARKHLASAEKELGKLERFFGR